MKLRILTFLAAARQSPLAPPSPSSSSHRGASPPAAPSSLPPRPTIPITRLPPARRFTATTLTQATKFLKTPPPTRSSFCTAQASSRKLGTRRPTTAKAFARSFCGGTFRSMLWTSRGAAAPGEPLATAKSRQRPMKASGSDNSVWDSGRTSTRAASFRRMPPPSISSSAR